MKRALVVKSLTDQIILVRTDSGELLSLAVPCRCINAGSMLQIHTGHTATRGCVIVSIDGHNCSESCNGKAVAVVIEHKDDSRSKDTLPGEEQRRHAI